MRITNISVEDSSDENDDDTRNTKAGSHETVASNSRNLLSPCRQVIRGVREAGGREEHSQGEGTENRGWRRP
ncbi:hypothetical protein E2C01_083435 [Portunus trituberculatus]|uniref:Uncharacterized protein n=1 Tax=Portunus trituberculatus TaxID=210409 RepID=A0A5B7J6K8_PORTR|nr:hypothetical protein [Portunus trituberculatus]